MCHLEERKHASTVNQFHNIEILQELLPPCDIPPMLIDDEEDEAAVGAAEVVIVISMEELCIVDDAMLVDIPDISIEEDISFFALQNSWC